jgi:hypothetical protein
LYYLHRYFAIHGKSDPTETAFSLKKEKIGGGNLKNAKAVSGGAQRTLACARRRGLCFSGVFLKIGSSLVVQGHQYRTHLVPFKIE